MTKVIWRVQMKIEIAEPGRMTQSGSSLLKLIQNNNMPILDLLVRESIQNSLDAKNEKDPYVTVEFLTGEFNKLALNNELEGIKDSLNKKYWKNEYKYIAIRDSNTVGLTGKMHYDEVTDNQYGNLLKLIYEISKPQETEGAGGSWGLGKTVYFRVGIGLVIYYSRIEMSKGNMSLVWLPLLWKMKWKTILLFRHCRGNLNVVLLGGVKRLVSIKQNRLQMNNI